MACCSGNFSRSRRCCLTYPASSCGSSYPSNLVYSTTSSNFSTRQPGSSLRSVYQESCVEPTSCQRFCMLSSPCQMPC